MSYDSMDAFELRAELEYWHGQVVMYAREYRQAAQSRDVVWAEGVGMNLDTALGQVKRLDALLKLGAAG